MEKALIKLASNIQGMDAALVVICFVIYRVIAISQKDKDDAKTGIIAVAGIAIVMAVGRVIITLME